MSSLKNKFMLFANLIVIISVIITSFFSFYIFYKGSMEKVTLFENRLINMEFKNIKSNLNMLESMLDTYLNGLRIIVDHLTKISKKYYISDKSLRLVVMDLNGNVLYDPMQKKKNKNLMFLNYIASCNERNAGNFFKNSYPGAEISFICGDEIFVVKRLKNFPYILAVIKKNLNLEIFKELKRKYEYDFKRSIIYVIISTIILLFFVGVFLNFVSKPYFNLVYSSIDILQKFSKGEIAGIEEDLKEFERYKEKEIVLIRNGLLEMKQGIGNLLSNIKGLVSSINRSSTDVQMAINEILKRLNENNQAIEEQVKTTESISSSILEIERSISEIKEFTNENKKIAEENFEKANYGYSQMKKLSSWLNEISNLSKRIDEIINVINDISKKTRLLSLNASIEASKAGEYGKGFSVVAEEIRKLADSSGSSANEISEYLKNINEKISEGISIVDEIHNNLESIKTTAKKNKEDIEKVAVAIEQQHISINLIAKNIVKYNEVVEINQKNFEKIITSVEQVEKTAKEFSNMAEELERLMEVFKI